MRVTGYCEKCHRFKNVRVTARGLIGRIPSGICSSCEEKEREDKRIVS